MAYTFVNGSFPAVDYESITVSTVSIGGTVSKLVVQTVVSLGGTEGRSYIDTKRIDEALFTVETNPVRFRLDGVDPTSSEGHLLSAGDSLLVVGHQNVYKLRFIRSGGSDGTVKATYYRKG